MSELVRVAILGTGQTTGKVDGGTEADALVAKLDLGAGAGEGARERELLLRAGAAAILRRAGTRARRWYAPIVAAGEETRRRAGPALASMIASLLDGGNAELLAEALEGLDRVELRLPEELLPKALEERDLTLRERLLPVLGARGRWLAEQGLDEGWTWARPLDPKEAEHRTLPPNADAAWAEGTLVERELLLTFARKLEPARGLAWVESSFKSDKPEQRRRWIELLEIGLSMADAPFLESALADRSSVVRVRAARALWRLPESRLARALRERVHAAFGPNLAIELPPEPFDPALERLGVVESPPQGVGKRQWWLAQLLSAVPPTAFEERSKRSPGALVAFAAEHELREPLLDGWTSGALRFESDAWLAPLWDAWSRDEAPQGWNTVNPLTALTERLLAKGRNAELDPRMLSAVREARHLELLSLLPRPWPASMARACIAHARARTPAFAWCLPLVATRMPIALAAADLDLGPAPDGKRDPFQNALEKFRMILDFRRMLSKEIEAQRADALEKGP